MTESIVTAAAAVARASCRRRCVLPLGQELKRRSAELQKSDERLQASIDQVREDMRELRNILLNQQRGD